jgi:uncharacterized protein (TIGR02246 family)
MRRFLLTVAFLAVCSASPLLAQSPDQMYTATREQLDVTKVVLAQEDAWNKGDLEAYLSHFKDAKDTEAILGGPVRGLEAIRSAYHANFPNKEAMGTLEQSEVEVRELGPDFALATGKYRLTRSRHGGGDAQGTFTEIFQKTAAGWQLIFSETT